MSVRARTTATTTIVVAVALAIAGAVLVLVVRGQLTDGVMKASEVRAEDVEGLLEGGALPTAVVSGDEEDALMQIVDDAVNHANHTVAISAVVERDYAVLRVDEDGVGIPAANRERVFERFVRLDAARSRDQGGSGLGLAIVKEIITNHDGSVTIADSPLGGASVQIRLPRFE